MLMAGWRKLTSPRSSGDDCGEIDFQVIEVLRGCFFYFIAKISIYCLFSREPKISLKELWCHCKFANYTIDYNSIKSVYRQREPYYQKHSTHTHHVTFNQNYKLYFYKRFYKYKITKYLYVHSHAGAHQPRDIRRHSSSPSFFLSPRDQFIIIQSYIDNTDNHRIRARASESDRAHARG